MAKILIFFCITGYLFADVFRVKSWKEIRSHHVVLQTYEESCGASSLATFLALYGIKKEEKEILSDFNTTDMVTFDMLAKQLEQYHFTAKGYKITPAIFDKLSFPFIAQITRQENYPHFVVVIPYLGDFIVLLDPSIGQMIVSKKSFYSDWLSSEGKGMVLIVKPKESLSYHTSYDIISELKYIQGLILPKL